jgi:predicted phosphodiesterase
VNRLRFAVISDMHGNAVATRAALDWIDHHGVDQILCAGDVANFGPQPNEVIALLAERAIPCAQGNDDWNYAHTAAVPLPNSPRMQQIQEINAWGLARLNAACRTWLAGLPFALAPHPELRVVHAGFESNSQIVNEENEPQFPAGVQVVAAGHLHIPLVLQRNGCIWVNAGSCGRSASGDARISLAIVEKNDSDWQARAFLLDYDMEASLQAIRDASMPYAERLIETQVKACWW